ncbi:hypothetical protein N7468_004475 [Penicillium chermesinum]|uniref:aldehyde dehydrogenase (NAD(+)) n=1 Tax=Penicillium chermesinum TaxID=63820 RepID=A0A9W9TSL8_9EURO|nr:uncharacterized protein N7468_004475 [Penicillium chermesinum]KAJ5239856.1 hypothetical protein N7468_004475 [Penicillium chermesinum]KAJ6166735.1 hypothetical protein N7470_002182 [Penicillium chermesinum]
MTNTTASLETRLFIDGKYVDAKHPERLTCYRPTDNTIVTDDVHVANQEDVDAAVAAARAAFPKWAAMAPAERAKILLKFADLIEQHGDELANLEALCNGKPTAVFKAYEVPLCAGAYRCEMHYAGWCDKVEGQSFPADNGFLKIVRHEPIGVCAAINAFNGPLVMCGFKGAPCLAAGNTMIMKASEKSPLSSLYLGKLANEAGIPPGVINFISGAGLTGALLASHMGIDKVSFTGSTATGKKIAKAAVESNLKRVSLELGGKSPSIVFPDANLDVAVQWCTQGIVGNSGQACIASSRVYVHESIRDVFIDQMKTAFEAAKAGFGDPFSKTTTLPPLIDKLQFDRVSKFVEEGKKQSTIVTGGCALSSEGCWMVPTIFVDPEPGASIYKEEIFGPVVVISSFKDEEEVLARANDTEFGLSGAVFSQDVNRALRVAGKLRSGTACVNCCTLVDLTTPFGGYKQSGWGRELGKAGIMSYLETKTVFVNMTY